MKTKKPSKNNEQKETAAYERKEERAATLDKKTLRNRLQKKGKK